MSYESSCFRNFVCFLIVQKKQAVTSPLFWIWDLSLHRNQLFEKILHVMELPSQEGFIEDFVYKMVLSRTWKRPCDFKHSSQFQRYFEKSKNNWFLHAHRYLKNCTQISQEILGHNIFRWGCYCCIGIWVKTYT